MKKILSGILVIAMIAVLAACGKKEEPGNEAHYRQQYTWNDYSE